MASKMLLVVQISKLRRPALAHLVSFSSEKADAEASNVIRLKAEFTNKFLKKLLQRYPTGKIRPFDTDGALVSSEEDPMTLDPGEPSDSSSNKNINPDRQKKPSKRDRYGSKVLTIAFPEGPANSLRLSMGRWRIRIRVGLLCSFTTNSARLHIRD